MKSQFLILFVAIGLTACGNSSNDKANAGGPTKAEQNRLNWESIPSEFNPAVIEENFQIGNSNRIYTDMFGFKDDVEVVYDEHLAAGQGSLKLYRVLKESGSSGALSATTSGQSLLLSRNGTYSCSIKTENRNITQLKGLCFIRLQIFLPKGSEIEVYNVKELITRRFIPIDPETFIKNFKDASFEDGKKAAIDDFISSYAELNKTPQLLSAQMGIVVHGFPFSEKKFEALRRLNGYVTDRQNLNAMIESEFSFFDRPEAKRICGL